MQLSTEQIKEIASQIARGLQWPEIMSPRTAGRYMDRTEKAVRHLISDGVLPPVQIDARVQVRKRDIDEAFERGLIQ